MVDKQFCQANKPVLLPDTKRLKLALVREDGTKPQVSMFTVTEKVANTFNSVKIEELLESTVEETRQRRSNSATNSQTQAPVEELRLKALNIVRRTSEPINSSKMREEVSRMMEDYLTTFLKCLGDKQESSQGTTNNNKILS